MASLLAETFTPCYLARLASCFLKTPDAILDLIFDRYSVWPMSSIPVVPTATAPTALTETMCRRLLPIINNPASMFSPDTVPFALCILLCYRMTPGDDVLNACDPAHLIMAAVLLANGWLSDWETNVHQFAIMANVTSDHMRVLKPKLLQNLGYRLWIPRRRVL